MTNTNLNSVEFINQNTGFIVGGNEILKTYDGGKHWELIAHSEFELRSVSFTDSLRGICAGGDWLHEYSGINTTVDGGENWDQISSVVTAKYLTKIKFVNPDTGYIVGGNGDTYGGFILKTTDAGTSWSKLNTGIDSYWITDMSLPDEKTILTVGNYGQILKSTDGGSSWVKQNSNTQENIHSVNFLDAETGYVFGDNGTILKTDDGGISWKKQESPTGQHLYSAFFKDANTGYVVSYDWNIDSCTLLLTTTDGGLNWKKKSIGRLRSPNKIVFVNQDTAFVAGDFGGILKTTDGGKTWQESYHHGNSYADLFFSDENTGYVLGEDGEISMTGNCGKDWTVLNSGTDKGLMSVFFTDINTGYAVGVNGIILKTTNSGSSLKALQQPFYNLCPGDSAVLQPNFIGGKKPLSFVWNQIGTTSTIKVAPEITTNYKVIITDQDLDTIQVNLRVDANSVPTPVITQYGDTLVSNMLFGIRWFKNDTLIADVYSDTLVVNKSGDYSVVIYDYGCYSEKSNVIHLITGTSNLECDEEFSLFPNPVSSGFNLTFPANYRNVELKLFDDKGKVIRRQTTSGSSVNMDIGDLPSGIYILQVVSGDLISTKKIIRK